MITYERYRADMERLGASHIPTEAEYNRSYGIETDRVEPLRITPKRDSRKVSASLENHIKISASAKRAKLKKSVNAPKKPRFSRAHMTEEQKAERTKMLRKQRYDRDKAAGKTGRKRTAEQSEAHKEYCKRYYRSKIDGKPKKPAKQKLTAEQKAEKARAYQREYMAKWRAMHSSVAYANQKAWLQKSEENMAKKREWNREYMRRKRAEKLKA